VLVFGEEDDELEHAVVRLLNKRQQTVAVAEWATDGLVSQWLAEAAAASACFCGGIVVRNVAMLESLLAMRVSADDIAAAETATAMGRAVREKCRADYGVAIPAFPTSGAQLPTAATTSQTTEMTGTLHVALATGENIRVKAFPLASHPAITKARSAKQALNMLRLAMLKGDR
jgi:nicotinamide mononucleotide (NMN) deamidase PncC